jgi:transposase
MSDEGLITHMTLAGGLNTPSFLAYLEKILLQQLWVGAIVVIDNLSFHHAEALESRIESVGEECEILISPFAGFISHRVVLVKNPSNSSL